MPFSAGRDLKRAQAINDFYDELFGAVDSSPSLASLEALLGWLKQHRDRETSNVRVHMLDAAVENVEEAGRK